jgi:hypothetical protein
MHITYIGRVAAYRTKGVKLKGGSNKEYLAPIG